MLYMQDIYNAYYDTKTGFQINRLSCIRLIDKNNISWTNEDIISVEENSKTDIRGG